MTEYTPDSCDEDCITVKDAQFLTGVIKIIYDTVLKGHLSIEEARKRIIKNIKKNRKAEFRQGDYDSRLISLFPKDKKVVTLNLLYHLCKEDNCCNKKEDYRGKRKDRNYCVGVAICLLPSIDCHEKCEVLGICQGVVKKGQPVLQNKADKGLYLFDCQKAKKCKARHNNGGDDKVYDEVVVVCCSGEDYTFPAGKSIDYSKVCKKCGSGLCDKSCSSKRGRNGSRSNSERRSVSCSPRGRRSKSGSRSRSRSRSESGSRSRSRSRSESGSRSRSRSRSKSGSRSKRRSVSCPPKKYRKSYSYQSDSSCSSSYRGDSSCSSSYRSDSSCSSSYRSGSSCSSSYRSGYSTPYYSNRSYSDHNSSCKNKIEKSKYKKCEREHYVIDSIVDYPVTPKYQKGHENKCQKGHENKCQKGHENKCQKGYENKCQKGNSAQKSIRHEGYRYGNDDQQQPNESHEEYCLRYYRKNNSY